MASDSLQVNDTTYAGTFGPNYILPALYGMDSINKGVLWVQDGIVKQHTIGRIDFSNPWQSRTADPVDGNGTITVDGRQLIPQDMMLFQPFNPRDLETHWEAEKLNPQILDRSIPPTFENFLTAMIVGRAHEQEENQVWMGSTTYTAAPGSAGNGQLVFYDGLMKTMINDSGVYKTGSASTISASNVIAAFQDLYAAAATNNKALLTNPKKYQRMKFLVSINTDLFYESALTDTTYKNNNTTDKGIRMYKGFEVVPLAGMPDNTVVFTEVAGDINGNLWYGLNSILDDNFQLARVTTFSERFAIKMLKKSCVNYGFSNKVFVYTTLTTSTFTA